MGGLFVYFFMKFFGIWYWSKYILKNIFFKVVNIATIIEVYFTKKVVSVFQLINFMFNLMCYLTFRDNFHSKITSKFQK